MLKAILFRPIYREPGWTYQVVRTTNQPKVYGDSMRAWWRHYPTGHPERD